MILMNFKKVVGWLNDHYVFSAAKLVEESAKKVKLKGHDVEYINHSELKGLIMPQLLRDMECDVTQEHIEDVDSIFEVAAERFDNTLKKLALPLTVTVHQKYTLEVKETGKKSGKYQYTVIDDTGKVLSTRSSNREYVACTINGQYYFGRLDLIGKGEHGRTNKFCAMEGIPETPIAYKK